ncbi:melatonin receptor type 1B-B [Gadus chalcogrammus]|uniref:melatonin receptor type 1B-B n=1 Tax=Gadus chalcogrammus TaxID=1042646 RepID=UPI0024C2C8EC|nr:melatonin receptor type 1B-B [Gadus chalcogrammus]
MEAWASGVFGALAALNSAASVAGNLLVLLLLLLDRELRAEASALSLSLALSDLGLGLSVLPLAAHSSLAGGPAGPGPPLCQAAGFLSVLLQTASLHSLAWLTLGRYSQLCLALGSGRLWAGRRTLGPLLLLWAFCLLTAALPLLGVGRYAYSRSTFLCGPGVEAEAAEAAVAAGGWGFSLYVLLVGALLPLGAVCALQACMAATARRQARRGTFACNRDHCFYVPASSYSRTAGLLLATSGCVLVCWLPYICVGVYQAVGGRAVPAEVSCLSAGLLLCCPSLNPWSFSMSHTSYRAALRRAVARVTPVFYRSGKTPQSPPQSSAHSTTDLANHSRAAITLHPPPLTPPPPVTSDLRLPG